MKPTKKTKAKLPEDEKILTGSNDKKFINTDRLKELKKHSKPKK